MPDFPEVFVFDSDDEAAAARRLAALVRDLGIEVPYVIASRRGRALARALEGPRGPDTPIAETDQAWAAEVARLAASSGADAVVAVGGGRCLDVAKLAAARAGLVNVAVPTQLSHDGICSPVAVVPNDDGLSESLGAIAPRMVFLSLPTLLGAPLKTIAAGLGDLLANPFALRDWKLAAERGLESIDQRAWDISVESFELIEGDLDTDPAVSRRDPKFVRRLADALVMSGLAMIVAGTSRPASGAEHEISHAIDALLGGRALHGEQVAFGCIFSSALYGDDIAPFRERLQRLGLPDQPLKLQLNTDELARVLLAAPGTRPGRFTILEDANLDEAGARDLIARIW